MKTKLNVLAICLIIFAAGFIIGADWPYLLQPDDFGVYAPDKKYKYVITKDETRLCQQICIMDENHQVLYHTQGYMNLGWHHGQYNLEVLWSRESHDLFVRDGRGTVDVYLYTGTTWQGPYDIKKTENSGFVITPPPYDHDIANLIYDDLPMEYPQAQIPEGLYH